MTSAALVADLAERALMLAQDPVPADHAAAAELAGVAAGGADPEWVLLAAMEAAWARIGRLTEDRLELAGRAGLLLGLAIITPTRS